MFAVQFFNMKNKKWKPDVLVVTPLLPGHSIHRELKKWIKRNTIPFAWVISIGENNIPTNVWNGVSWYEKTNGHSPKYILPIDRDIVMGRGMIDKMYQCFETNKDSKVAYVYASFEFKGAINQKFPAVPFDPNRLMQSNHISSNSMIKLSLLKEVGGPVTGNKYKRLLDWALWLKFYKYGYVGRPCPQASFVAISTDKDVSAQGEDDYREKATAVYEDFISPILEKEKKEEKSNQVINNNITELDIDAL